MGNKYFDSSSSYRSSYQQQDTILKEIEMYSSGIDLIDSFNSSVNSIYQGFEILSVRLIGSKEEIRNFHSEQDVRINYISRDSLTENSIKGYVENISSDKNNFIIIRVKIMAGNLRKSALPIGSIVNMEFIKMENISGRILNNLKKYYSHQ